MADKNSVADWDTDPDNNDNVGGVNIAEDCAMSNLNNGMREMMAQIKDAGFVGTSALATYAKLDTADQTVTGGARITPLQIGGGTVTSGTVTPDPGDRPIQYYTNGGAHTLAPGTNKGSYLLEITNNSSAGAVTVSGWTKVNGAFNTTNGNKFLCSCIVSQTYSLLSITALQ